MSIELPEAKILAKQLKKELCYKRIRSYQLKNYERLQKIGMLNKDIKTFDLLIKKEIKSIISRGNVICIKLNNGVNLILAPEYGGQIFYHKSEKMVPKKFHLKIIFVDNTILTVKLTSMGVIQIIKDENLEQSYIYRRDFNTMVPSPLDSKFTIDSFLRLLKNNNRMLKSILVGKDAVVVGISNYTFQDIVYRAKLHPKKKASDLSKNEIQSLYETIKLVLQSRIQLNGKDKFYDLYGKKGRYSPAMGSNMKNKLCFVCSYIAIDFSLLISTLFVESIPFPKRCTFFMPSCSRTSQNLTFCK